MTALAIKAGASNRRSATWSMKPGQAFPISDDRPFDDARRELGDNVCGVS